MLAVVVLGTAQLVTTQPGPNFGLGSGAPEGIQIVSAPFGTRGPDAYYVDATPGGRFRVTVVIRNSGALPVRILGLVSDHDPGMTLPRWTALGFYRTDGAIPGIDAARPFEPFELQPSEHVVLYAVGQAGPCAARPGEPSHAGVGLPIMLAHSTLGLNAVTELDTPFAIVEYQAEDCPQLRD